MALQNLPVPFLPSDRGANESGRHWAGRGQLGSQEGSWDSEARAPATAVGHAGPCLCQ